MAKTNIVPHPCTRDNAILLSYLCYYTPYIDILTDMDSYATTLSLLLAPYIYLCTHH